jgi:hypothetical protein
MNLESMGEELECDGALEAGVLGLVDDTHPAFTDLLKDPVMRNRLTDEGGHGNSSKKREKRRCPSPKVGGKVAFSQECCGEVKGDHGESQTSRFPPPGGRK